MSQRQRGDMVILAHIREQHRLSLEFNEEKGKEFDVAKSITAQLPFFACVNHVRDEKYMKLLNKYLYCTETGTPAHLGSYGEQPARWVQYFFIIKNAMAKKMNNVKEKAKKDV